jgi:hypothetical protein
VKLLPHLVILLFLCNGAIAAKRDCGEFEKIAGIQTKISGKKSYFLSADLINPH